MTIFNLTERQNHRVEMQDLSSPDVPFTLHSCLTYTRYAYLYIYTYKCNNIRVMGLGHWQLGSTTGWCNLLDISTEIKVHSKIGCGLVYLPHF